ncbi:hypothetical protein Hanom_Chr15g01387791 [Helianthus anomalus]
MIAFVAGHNLTKLKLGFGCVTVENLNPMPMTVEFILLEDEDLNELNKCFPNLQVLNLVCFDGLKDPKIHLLHLQTCDLTLHTLITPNLITLRIEYFPSIHVIPCYGRLTTKKV